jgi:hypothetical protein
MSDVAFETNPHLAFLRLVKLNCNRSIETSGCAPSANPPVLHRKETFPLPDDLRQAKSDHPDRRQERTGPLDELASIGTRSGRADRLRERGDPPPTFHRAAAGPPDPSSSAVRERTGERHGLPPGKSRAARRTPPRQPTHPIPADRDELDE